jgi:NADPH:quinone reductase-like Zn-dependent oxidoreductase
VVPVPESLSDEQAASFFVNPTSALAMVHHVLGVGAGERLLQTAAGSALGRMVIRLGKRHRFRTINIVRRGEQADELHRLGADAVICSDNEPIVERVHALTNGAGVPYAIDPVGGETGSAVVSCLGVGGRLIVYGTLSGQPMTVNSRTLMTGDRTIEGFWLSNWVSRQGTVTMLRLFREIRQLMRDGVLDSEVGSSFRLDQIQEAVEQAEKPGRKGKVVLKLAEK